METLRVHNVSKIYGEGHVAVKALEHIHLHVEPKEVVLIMGPSGSGKTTLLTIAGGLLRPTEGEVTIDGLKITKLSERRLPLVRRKSIGFIFQNFNLFESLSALENVELVLRVSGVGGRQSREKATRLLTDLGLEGRLNFRPNKLSGGEKQRVSIARALANDPQVVLADEPTANLDSKNGRQVMELLRKVAKEEGRAVVIVSHDDRIRDIADRVLWLQDGKLFNDPGMEKPTDCQCEKMK
ncbi:hypothetical protein A2890_01070 [candidate division WWE3 bacterium RIFCSPLOWO2_01_FULL_53_14]|uniref:ABC transporter domain-containing protein n=1 Tax=candidate division WWE3 bacterium RIFCSPLOWO2_01_FULL_53_14 TaxID=1802628 RepID=A0A1F4VVZ9_UNCKA|nr:MAG: hypothetical protein A2890_01070 [candidate division WWE3 bacterium RIFCSPLOWO2_01_FULL_53_14]